MKQKSLFLFFVILFIVGGCSNTTSKTRTQNDSGQVITGNATWYGKKFHGKKTASGERFNMFTMSAAHKSLEFGKKVIVTNIENGKSIEVYIYDRGPFIKGVVLDLSYAAFKEIADINDGIIKVKMEVLE